MAYYQIPQLGHIPYTARPFTQRPSVRPVYDPGPIGKRRQPDQPSFDVLDYNDPLEINSLADILLNEAGLNKLYPSKYDKPEQFDLGDVSQRLQALIGPDSLAMRATIKPILQGYQDTKRTGVNQSWKGYQTAALNVVQNFGETMDILANPVKGWLLEKDGPDKGFIRGLGIGKEGRQNYDFDFKVPGGKAANLPLNILAEVLVDPFNWITLGGYAVGKMAAGAAADTLTKTIRRAAVEAGQEITEAKVKRLAKATASALRRNPEDLAGAMKRGVMSASRATATEVADPKLLSNFFLERWAQEMTTAANDHLAIQTMKAMKRLVDTSEGIEKVLLHSSLMYGGFPSKPLALAVKHGAYNPLMSWIAAKSEAGLQAYRAADGTIPINKLESALNDWEAVLKYKLSDPEIPGDAMQDLAKTLRVSSIEADASTLAELLKNKKPQALLRKLDDYFLGKTGEFNFHQFVEYMEAFAAKYPDFEHYTTTLKAVQNYLDNLHKYSQTKLMNSAAEKLQDTVRMLSKTIEDNLDVGRVQLQTVRQMQELTNGLTRNIRMLENFDVEQGDRHALEQLQQRMRNLYRYLDDFDLERHAFEVKITPELELYEAVLTNKTTDLLRRAPVYIPTKEENILAEQIENLFRSKDWTAVDLSSFQQLTGLEDYLGEAPHELTQMANVLQAVTRGQPRVRNMLPGLFSGVSLEDTLYEYAKSVQDTLAQMENLKTLRLGPTPKLEKAWFNAGQELGRIQERLENIHELLTYDLNHYSEQIDALMGQHVYMTELERLIRENVHRPLEEILELSEQMHPAANGYTPVPENIYQRLTERMDRIMVQLQQDNAYEAEYFLRVFDDDYADLLKARAENNPSKVMAALFHIETRIKDMQDAFSSSQSVFRRDLNVPHVRKISWGDVILTSHPEMADEIESLLKKIAKGQALDAEGLQKTMRQLSEGVEEVMRKQAMTEQSLIDLRKAIAQRNTQKITTSKTDTLRMALRQQENKLLGDLEAYKLYLNDTTIREYNEVLSTLSDDVLNGVDNADAAFRKHAEALEKLLEPLSKTTSDNELLEELLDEALSVFSDIDTRYYDPDLLGYIQDKIKYHLKISQARAALMLLDNPSLDKLVDDILIYRGNGQLLESLHDIPEYAEHVKEIQMFAHSHQRYRTLLNQLFSSEQLKPVAANVFDTLQTFKTRDLQYMLAYREYYAGQIMQGLQDQLTSVQVRKSYALDNIFKGSGDSEKVWEAKFAAWRTRNGIKDFKAHRADSDALKTIFLFEEDAFLKRAAADFDTDNFIQVAVDLETSGVEVTRDRILQLAWNRFDNKTGKLYNIKADPNLYPAEEVLDKIYGGMDEYRRVHQGLGAIDEREALETFIADMKGLEELTGKRVQIVSHNGEAFDFGMLSARVRSLGGEDGYRNLRYLENLNKTDSLTELHRLNQVAHLTREQKGELRSMLLTYLSGREQSVLADIPTQHFIDTIDGDVAKRMQMLADALYDAGDEAYMPLAYELVGISQNIWDSLLSVSRMNDALRGATFSVDPLTKTILGANGKPLQIAGMPNVVQLFADKPGQFMEYALRTQYESTPAVRTYFRNIADQGEVFTRRQMQQIHYFSTDARKMAGYVKRADLAAEHYTVYQDLADKVKKQLEIWSVQTGLPMPLTVQYYDPSIVGTIDRYVGTYKMMQALRDFAKKHGLHTEYTAFVDTFGKLGKGQSDALETILKPKIMYRFPSDLHPGAQEYTSSFFTLNPTKEMHNNQGMRRGLEFIDGDVAQIQTDLALLSAQNSIEGAVTRMQASLLEVSNRRWNRLLDYAGNLDAAGKRQLELDMRQLANRTALAQMEYLVRLPHSELQDYLWLAEGRITFAVPSGIGAEYGAVLRRTRDYFERNAAALQKQHISSYFDPVTERMFIWLDNDPGLVKQKIDFDLSWKKKNYLEQTYDDPYSRFYVEHTPYLQDSLRLDPQVQALVADGKQHLVDITRGRAQGTLGDMVFESTLEAIDNAAPPHIRKLFIPVDRFKEALHFDSTIVFNRSNIGLDMGRHELVRGTSANILKNYTNAAQYLVPMLDVKIKAKHLFFDDMYQLSGPLYEGFSNSELIELYRKNPQLRLATLVQDDKYGALVRELKPHSAEDFARYKAQGIDVSFLPSGAFLQAYKYINTFDFGTGVAKFLHKYMVGPMKAGYLSSMGFVFRNIIDSMGKNIMLAGNPLEAGRMVKHTLEMSRHYRAYNDIMHQVLKHADNKSKMFSHRILDKVYETPQLINKDYFNLLHDFIEQGPSAGLSKLQMDELATKFSSRRTKLGITKKDNLFEEVVWRNPWTKMLLEKNSELEQIFRLSGFTWSIMDGKTMDEAIDAVLRTHFDYSLKTKAHMMGEYVVPFTTFVTNNTLFWLDAMNNIGWLGSIMRDIFTPIWNLDEYSNRELNENRSLQYNILAGNIILDDNVTVKLSPSIMDAMRLLTNPEEAKSRVTAYIKVPWEIIKNAISPQPYFNMPRLIATNLPLIGPTIQRAWHSDNKYEMGSIQSIRERTGKNWPAAVPSIFGAVQRNYYFGYPGSGTVYMTHDEDKYEEALRSGAFEVTGKMQAAINNYLRSPTTKAAYTPKTFAKRYYPPKKPRQTFQKKPRAIRPAYQKKPRKLWVPKVYPQQYRMPRNTVYANARFREAARGMTIRMPYSHNIMASIKPALYRRLYTGSGTARFKSRLIPINNKNIINKLKADWAYLR